MSRPRFPFIAKDVSALARSLQRELAACAMPSESANLTDGTSGNPGGSAGDAPCIPANAPGHISHVQLLNMLVRAVGYRNFQHYRAQFAAQERLQRLAAPEPAAPEEPVDLRRVERAARHFGPDGLLARWPGKVSLQRLCLWWVWSRLPAGQELTGTRMDDALRACHHFGDHALLRRWLCDLGMATRTPDGRQYRRVEQRPPQEALALLQHLRDRERHARPAGHTRQAGHGVTAA
uniref:DUF2087 domain-containing protein n=1 Tax=Nitratidesulfovibrio vulgaris (strain DSM 19637 / Miyazaki F) TaxID=883 RepID=B8DIG4_NITV9